MKRIVAMLGAAFLLAGSAGAEDQLITEARQAVAEGLPQVAVAKLQRVGEGWTSEEDARTAQLLLGKALLEAGRPEEAVKVLTAIVDLDPASRFDLARAQTAMGESAVALELYEGLASDPELSAPAVIGAARILHAQGETAEAERRLEAFGERHPDRTDVATMLAAFRIDAGDAAGAQKALARVPKSAPGQRGGEQADYLRARALLLSGQTEPAREILRRIEDPPVALAPGIIIALAECENARNQDGPKILEEFIEENPLMPGLGEVFVALDEMTTAEETPISDLREWAKDESHPARAAWAQYYRAWAEYRSGRTDKGMGQLQDFLASYPGHPLTETVLGDLAAWELADGDPGRALEVARKGSGPRLRFVEGQALVSLGQLPEAAACFMQAAALPEIALSALTNSALCAMLVGVPDSENQALEKLAACEEGAEAIEWFSFLEAMHRAAQRDVDALVHLQEIAGSSSPWAASAQLAIAEWENLQLNRQGAWDALRKVSLSDPEEAERAAYLEVFLTDSGDPDAEKRTMEMATAFLEAHPDSRFEPEVRMKLGEVLHRRGDYLGSYAQFALIAEDFPDSPLAGPALFLAGQAKARSLSLEARTEAIEIYEQVAQGGGPLSLRARLSQAVLFNALHRPQEALGVLENVLAGNPDPDLRSLILIEMGDTHFAQGEKDPEELRKAIASWEKLVAFPEASPSMRHQALVKMGAAYEKLGEQDAALEYYHQVFSGDQEAEPEYFWYYKAGFDAGRLLESRELWKEAIVVYEKIAASEGPRSGEARDRVNKLRLENFIWEN